MLNVLMMSPGRLLYEGMAQRIIVPGERGTFEMLTLHRSLVSRLIRGVVTIDEKRYPIQRGIISVVNDTVTAVVEPAA